MKTVEHITKPTFSHVKDFIKQWKLKPKDIISIYQTEFNGDYNLIFWRRSKRKMNEIDRDNFKFCLGLAGVIIFALLMFGGVPHLIMWIIEKLLRR